MQTEQEKAAMKAAFEEWAISKGFDVRKIAFCYLNDYTQNAYLGWKAAYGHSATPPTSLVGSESPAKPVPVPRTVLQAATEAGRQRFPEWETNPIHGRAASVYAQGYLEHFRVTALGGVSSPGGEAEHE